MCVYAWEGQSECLVNLVLGWVRMSWCLRPVWEDALWMPHVESTVFRIVVVCFRAQNQVTCLASHQFFYWTFTFWEAGRTLVKLRGSHIHWIFQVYSSRARQFLHTGAGEKIAFRGARESGISSERAWSSGHQRRLWLSPASNREVRSAKYHRVASNWRIIL